MDSMESIVCPNCNSSDVYYIPMKQKYCCDKCGFTFEIKTDFQPQKIFISYGHDKNKEFVEEIKKKLLERGHNPWIDSAEIKPGNNWRSEITNGISDCNDFLAFISEHSVRNPGVCLDEIAIALGIKECVIQSILLEKDVFPPNSISTNQWLDLSDWYEMKQKGGFTWENWLNGKMEALYEVIENPKNYSRFNEINDIKKKLNPLLPDIKIRLLLQGDCVPRKWMISKVENWIENESRIFMLIGNPGTGKSVICALLSNYIINVGAVFFIEWKNNDSQRADKLVCSIAFQLACNINDYRESLHKIVSGQNVANCSEMSLCDLLIISPLNELIDGGREKQIIIIDAIDEIREEYRKPLFDIIRKIIDETPQWITFVLTGRPEVSVLNSFSSYNPQLLNLFQDKVKDDFLEYIKKQCSNEEMVQAIYEKSEGSFSYVNELMKQYDKNTFSLEDIQTLPRGVAALYYENFERIIGNIYDDDFSTMLSLIAYAYEPLRITFIADVMNQKPKKILSKLTLLSSYMSIFEYNSEDYITINHKSLVDWLTAKDAGKYYLDKSEAHDCFSEHFMEVLKFDGDFGEYYAEYGYNHLVKSNLWKGLNRSRQKTIIEKCIGAAKQYGKIKKEKELLDIYDLQQYDDIMYSIQALDYSVRVNEKTGKDLCERIINYSRDEKDLRKKYEMIEPVAIAYFYLGEDKLSFDMLRDFKENHSDLFLDDYILATWNHSISLSAHDMDKNEFVVTTSKKSAELYVKEEKYYEYYISLINLFDAYMGTGDLENAERTAKRVFQLNEERYFIHVDDILKICYANVLQESGRIMESLYYYEKGCLIAKDIQQWDYLYGSIWRELAVAKFHDSSSLKRLQEFVEESRNQEFYYLVSLGECFYILSSWILKQYEEDILDKYISEIKEIGLQGHCLQASVALELIKEYRGLSVGEIETDIEGYMHEAEGVKGFPEIIAVYYADGKHSQSDYAKAWCEKYISPILDYKDNYRKELISRRTYGSEPYYMKPACASCEAKCCYDGVYLRNNQEEARITELIKMFPSEFMSLPEDYIVAGNWPGMENERKTAVREREYKTEDFPKHFNKTACVFNMENGECLLQRVATDHQLHPWFAKPCACWSFPIRGFDKHENKIISPPKCNETDPDYLNEEYPGYTTFLPCGKPYDSKDNDVESWTSLYINEIEYYDFLINTHRFK